MSTFQETLSTLPAIDGLSRLELYSSDSATPTWVIENQPGKTGSLAVYYKVCIDHGGLTPAAAEQALELYAEHTRDARVNPGKHPNIDYLFSIIENQTYLAAKAIPRPA